MKPIFSILLMFWGFMACHAQNGTKYLSTKGGVGLKEIHTGGVSLDFNGRYHNQHEIFGEWVSSSKTDYQTIMVGFAAKPALLRSNNSTLRLRAGAGIGSDTRKAVAAPQLGLEFSQTLGNRMDILVGNVNQAVLWAPKQERWRLLLALGIRIPLN
ncbi:hypothetical protein P872_06085 [Rhodonellum psychrophilum GCM71 = DSM 17998]|uniref:Outer membrane protein beta-barrel domain-containing protein n=2 Tax=Rhodonellum TaxID=336827 RepID=U5BR23_9BACT|nr:MULTISPECIES: hypothetical protein [Rhodonellum]ERM83040.1 hypothetical protein P872_06085 [Rhodonellum psychrophilum GCM71 = DSM 17998]SDZ47517.1 hypothetical protein SAMN05444412_11654 [Rhodonellum ikkaensis]